MRIVFLFFVSITVANALECIHFIDSPLLPSNLDANKTCTGNYCYRIEYGITHLAIEANEQSIIMGCFDFPIEMTILGCRRNMEGLILCVCDVDRCNEDASSDIRDLPVVRDCRDQLAADGVKDNRKTCASHYCINSRGAQEPSQNLGAAHYFTCQNYHNSPLERFDLFVSTGGASIPAGICISYQETSSYIDEMCSCAHRENCSTSSQFPGNSSLPLDTRTEGMIKCATLSVNAGMRTCRGHVCFIRKRYYRTDDYGCITYDEHFMDKRYKMGSQRILSDVFYICDKNMCNADVNPHDVFKGSLSFEIPPVNESCNCLASPEKIFEIATGGLNIALLLSISIPVAIVIVIASVVVSFRIYFGQWPRFFSHISDNVKGPRVSQKTTVISVVSASSKKT